MSRTDGFVFDDGGREASGRKGDAGDCVVRAVVIASGRSYGEVYDLLAKGKGSQRLTVRDRRRGRSRHAATARDGINTTRKWFKDLMAEFGFEWVPTMKIGQGCKVHLCAEELPAGRLVVAVSKHYTAMIDGVIRDTHDPRRDGGVIVGRKDGVDFREEFGGRCVYGYWRLTK